MLKMSKLSNELNPAKNNGKRPASNKNNKSTLVSKKNDSNDEVNRFGGNSVKYAKKSEKSEKLSKSKKLERKKLAKSKKLSKNENSPKFHIKKAGPSFLTPNNKMVFNRLWLTFIKV